MSELFQDDFFADALPLPKPQAAQAQPEIEVPKSAATRKPARGELSVAPEAAQYSELAAQLPSNPRFGASTWSYPGWDGLVWDGVYDASTLSRKGLTALSQHPLMRTVCVDRSFWRPLSTEQYAQMAAQVPEDFRFVVKAPSLVTDALVLSPRADGVVLVVRQNRTTHSDLRHALSGLNFGMAKVLGIILNDVEEGGRVGYHQKYGYDKYIKTERRRGLLFFLHG